MRETRDEMVCRAVGGTISTSAARRSYKVSAAGTSDETEDSDTDDDVRDEEVEA